MTARFGTDGVRGLANVEITAELALAVGRATAARFGAAEVLIGRDTRRSGPMLEAALAAGVCSHGADAVLLGVVPTPAVAATSAERDAPGVVISASHNPAADNGLKIFAPGGRKLDDDEQSAVETLIEQALAGTPGAFGATLPIGDAVGTVRSDPFAGDRYLDRVAAAVPQDALSGMSVVLDCANGANHELAPVLFDRLGARVSVIAAEPDGSNINDGCGSTHPAGLAEQVRRRGADLGVAFDGDADRVLAVDHRGELVDGDRIIALCALDLHVRGRLAGNSVVVTVMSNLGFRHAMEAAGIHVVETPVGDRNVLEALDAGGFSLGGEQSGHIIFSELSTTGDGLLAAVTLAELVRRSGRPLAELAERVMTQVPQVLLNVTVDTPRPDVARQLEPQLDDARARLGDTGRVLVRPSGTEPVVRVMVEATDRRLAEQVAASLADAVRSLGS